MFCVDVGFPLGIGIPVLAKMALQIPQRREEICISIVSHLITHEEKRGGAAARRKVACSARQSVSLVRVEVLCSTGKNALMQISPCSSTY